MADDAGALLVRAGLITADHLAAARASQANDGGTIGEHLVVAGMVSDEKLTEFYRTRLLVPQVHPNTLARLTPSVIGLLPADLAAELRAVPVALDKDGNLTVAMSDPSDRHAVDEIGFFTGKYVVRAVATQMQIAWCLAQYYDCLTELGEQLLQPVAPAAAPVAAPAPAPAPAPDTMKPVVARSGDTSRIEASRHKVLAPVTNPPPMVQVRPVAGVLDRSSPTPAPVASFSAPTPIAAVPAPVPVAAPAPGPSIPIAVSAQAAVVPTTPATPVGGVPAPVPFAARPHALLPTSLPAIEVPVDDAPPAGPTPLPRGAFGGSTAETEPPPEASVWQRKTEQAPAVDAEVARASSPSMEITIEAAPASEGTPEQTSEIFDDTPSIIISADFARPTRERVVLPDPPELAARTGEMEMIELANRIFEAPTTSIEINFGPDEPDAAPDAPAATPAPAPASAAAAFEATTVVGPAPAPAVGAPASDAVPASGPTAITAPMGALIPPPALEPRPQLLGPESVVTSVGGRALSEPMIEVIAAEASSRTAIPLASPEADTRRLTDAELAALALLVPPEVPSSDGTPEAIGADADADARADTEAESDAEPGSEYETVPASEDDAADEDAAAIVHARRPGAVIEDAIDDEDALSAPILLTTPRRSGAISTQQPAVDDAPAEIHAPRPQAIVVDAIDDASGPVLLTDRMRRREARRREKGTMIGIGDLGPIPRSVEPTPSPYALPPHAAPEVPPPEAPHPEAAAVPSHVPDAFSEGVATVRRALVFEEHDDLDDGWGAPGTTIPPGFLGAVPSEIHDRPSEPAAPPAPAPTPEPAPAAASPAPVAVVEPRTQRLVSPVDRRTEKLQVVLPAIPPPRLTPPGARPAATLTPLNRNRTVAGVPDATHLADLLEQASQRLVELLHGFDVATHRDRVIAALVDFVGESHHRVAFLALRGEELIPFMQIPPPAGASAHLDVRAAATFQDVIGTRLPYRGPISDPPSRELVRELFGSATDEMLLVPVAVRDRVVGVLYADGRHRHSFDEHVTVAGRAAGLALQRILKEKKQ